MNFSGYEVNFFFLFQSGRLRAVWVSTPMNASVALFLVVFVWINNNLFIYENRDALTSSTWNLGYRLSANCQYLDGYPN